MVGGSHETTLATGHVKDSWWVLVVGVVVIVVIIIVTIVGPHPSTSQAYSSISPDAEPMKNY